MEMSSESVVSLDLRATGKLFHMTCPLTLTAKLLSPQVRGTESKPALADRKCERPVLSIVDLG